MSNSLTITATLADDFIAVLDEIIDSELAIAQKKWKLTLTEEEQAHVRKSTLEQLRSKVSTLSKNTWDLGSTLVINVAGETGNLSVSHDSPLNSTLSFVLTKNGWAATNEESDSVVAGDKFFDNLLSTLFTWTRTAVFYGVGSYGAR